MGQTQSGDARAVRQAVEEVQKKIDEAPNGGSIELYKYVSAGQAGQWKMVTSDARPLFYDALEEDNTSEGKHDWFLEVDGSDVDVHIDQAAGFLVNTAAKRVMFNAEAHVYYMRFKEEAMFKSFTKELSDKQFSNTYGMENDEAGRTKTLGADYADRLFNFDTARKADQQPMDADEEAGQCATPEKLREQAAFHEDEEDDPIMGVVMGANDNSYLLKGGAKFDVLRNVVGGVESKSISFSLTPAKGSKSAAAAAFTPSRVLLVQGERKMNLLTPENPNLLHHADVETGQIVNTFSFQKDTVDIPMRDISHDTKSSQMEETSTFLGLDNNRLARWDLRDPKGRVAESPVVSWEDGHDYTRGTNFTCMASSGDGFVVVGSQDGKIRLYSSKSLTRAQSAIPGLGAPITSVDVTYDGKWVVATSDHYLMVVRTTYKNDKGVACNAFTSRMGARGCMPRLLRLKPEDVARTGGMPLTKGKFSWITESGHTERWIVVSCGKFSIVWNFTKVKSSSSDMLAVGGLPTNMDYIISSKDEEVVDAAFQHCRYEAPTADTSIIIATQHDLFNVQ